MPERLCERKIFVSSTIGNLREERQVVQERLRKPFDHVRFHAVFSENPETLHMSGDDLKTYVGDNPNLFILNQIKYADYFMLLLNDQYYGEKNIRDLGNIRGQEEIISITHAEFRTAFRQAQPIFVFIEKDTMRRYFWGYRKRFFKRKMGDRDTRVYEFIHEIRKYRKGLNMTVTTYSSTKDLTDKMEFVFNSYDKSKYVFSEFDEEVCKSGDEIIAIWDVINQGCIVWRGRFFKEQNTSFRRFVRESGKALLRSRDDIGFHKRFLTFIRKWIQYIGIILHGRRSTAEKEYYPISETYPGEKARLRVKYIAPNISGEIVSSWIMVDSTGRKIYRNIVPLEAEYFVEGTQNARTNLFSKLRRGATDRKGS